MSSDIGGVWRTIGGRRVFIKNGQDLPSAMKESGKFSNNLIEKNVESLNKIDRLADEAQHYINDFNIEKFEKKGREMGAKDFEDYVNKLRHESYERRNDYNKGDVIEYDSNFNGVTPRWNQREILQVESDIATHGYTRPDNVYLVRDINRGNEYKVNANSVGKRIRKKV